MATWYDPYLLLGDPVIVTDADHRILTVNNAYEEASGYRREDIIGKDAGYIKSGLTPPYVYQSMKECLEQDKVWKGILTNRRPDGRLWNSSLTITPMRRPDGLYYLGVCRDVQDITSQDVADAYQQLFFLIAEIAEAGDPSVKPHLFRVRQICTSLARWLGWPEIQVTWLGTASVLHDVGKLYIPREILFKPGPLTHQERCLIETHTSLGAELLARLNDNMAKIYGYNEALVMAKDIAECHHEHVDGGGYPKGLRGDEIPESARIVALADVTDALLSHRPYKTPWSSPSVQEYLRQKRGRQFDPAMVNVLLEHWEDIEQLYRQEDRRDKMSS
ncbi:HD domain-containing phosphohydrolase [Kyrpidia sp.]|uniref:HD domain-containing phosphohydrolase n=1 Tax=Kyrpidia sp. TaxID=2073077 RepID=UPI0017A29DB0|nr:HD domain-containing phosphohydrolase [Kyrpidia sp.]MCL6577078.1 PAS domain S-box protein [Kyrpidia sp.]HHY67828.1 PAS domain S-box protein [Alicyclobacillus sp.]